MITQLFYNIGMGIKNKKKHVEVEHNQSGRYKGVFNYTEYEWTHFADGNGKTALIGLTLQQI